MKKPSKKTWRRKLNALLREYLALRDGEKCLRCGRTAGALHMSHIYPKGKHRKLEFDHENLKLLCFQCHFMFWHKSPIEAHTWLKTAISSDRLARLKRKAQSVQPDSLEYQKIYEELLEKIALLKSKPQHHVRDDGF